MTKYTSLAIALTATTFWSAPAIAAPLTPTLGKAGAYTLETIDKSKFDPDNSTMFADYYLTQDGNVTPYYYQYQIKTGLKSHARIEDGHTINKNDIASDFFNLTATDNGGAIHNSYSFSSESGYIGDIRADFINNSTTNETYAYGGAIYNGYEIKNITGDFIGNHVDGNTHGYGSAIMNDSGSEIATISGNFIKNYAIANSYAGAVIYNHGKINNIFADFIGNYAIGNGALGLVITNTNRVGVISGSFINNYALLEDTFAPAVYSSQPITIASRGKDIFFSGNYAENKLNGQRKYQAIFMKKFSVVPALTLDAFQGGNIIFNDSIEGGQLNNGKYDYNQQFNLTIKGNGNNKVIINNDIVNSGNINVNDVTLKFGEFTQADGTHSIGQFLTGVDGKDPVTNLSFTNSIFDLHNNYYDNLKIKNLTAAASQLNVNVGKKDNAWTADKVSVNGELSGDYKVNVYSLSKVPDIGTSVVFLEALNDTNPDDETITVNRVYGSPYLWLAERNKNGETDGSTWYLVMDSTVNPDFEITPEPEPDPVLPDIPETPDTPVPGASNKVVAEVIAYTGLHSAAVEQTRSLVGNIKSKVTVNSLLPDFCLSAEDDKDNLCKSTLYNAWVNPIYHYTNIKAPVDMDADIWGIEAGGDLQHDLNNKLGLFLSYRKGNYDMNGDGKHHYSTIGSEIDIDSYLAGLYYRYDRNNWWTFATVYGGIQRVDLKTKDGIKSDTDGTEFGGSVELGYDYNLSKTLYLTPSVGAFYTQLNYGDASDSAGKTAEYGLLRQLELEAGVKLTKAFVTDEGYANVYVKPSVVQTITDGDEVRITGLGKVNTLEDQTLGRIELGGRYGFTEQLSAYGWANHTFGDDYKASTFGLGLSYSW